MRRGLPGIASVLALMLVVPGTCLIQASAAAPSSPLTAVSTNQYHLSNSDGASWVAIDPANLTVRFTPSANTTAVISGNTDLWTANAGVNQDLGLSVSGGAYPSVPGQPETWKESGGSGGTFSPNAAMVETVIAVQASTTYTVTLEWKANHRTVGTIYAGAGAGPDFSPTRVAVQIESSGTLTPFTSTVTQAQLQLKGSDGSTWQDIAGAEHPILPLQNGELIASGNADLWTANQGVGEDLGISVSDGGRGTYPTTAGQPEAWKESGGFEGTFSPKAAYVQAIFPVIAGIPYAVKLQWKANHATTGTIYVGAGPINGKFSPTTLTLRLITGATVDQVVSTQQYRLDNSDGNTWIDMDATGLSLSITPPSNCTAVFSGNVDLWTATVDVNQDVGFSLSSTGGTLSPTAVGWKESGGGGIFSPNAAFVQSVLPLNSGTTYTVGLQWKANRAAPGSTIFAGAGPIQGHFSPTRLAALVTC